jgi:5-methylcytosine-specific restriction endonuclease McrA
MIHEKPKDKKPVGERNGIKIFTRLQGKVGLKAKNLTFKKRKPIKQMSEKQKVKNKTLSEQRKILLSKSDGTCSVCGNLPDFRGLQVHHKIFRSKGGKNNINNLELICGDCHDKKHGIKVGE